MALLFKVKFDGTIFTYDYHVRVAYVTTFDHPQTQNFYLQHPRTMCLTNVVGLNYMTRSVMKSWQMLVVYNSCKQKSYHLNNDLNALINLKPLVGKIGCLGEFDFDLQCFLLYYREILISTLAKEWGFCKSVPTYTQGNNTAKEIRSRFLCHCIRWSSTLLAVVYTSILPSSTYIVVSI